MPIHHLYGYTNRASNDRPLEQTTGYIAYFRRNTYGDLLRHLISLERVILVRDSVSLQAISKITPKTIFERLPVRTE